MCFAFDSRPPAPPADLVLAPIGGGAGAEVLELESADGTRFSAALAEAASGGSVGVVVLPDVRGLYRFYTEFAEQLAEAGHPAIAIDYFGRNAGLGPRDEDFEYRSHAMEMKLEQVHLDIASAIGRSVSGPGSRGWPRSVSASGDCSLCSPTPTGIWDCHAPSASTPRSMALASGSPGRWPGRPRFAARSWAVRRRGPGNFGGTGERVRVPSGGDVEHQIHVYPGAPHSFSYRRYDEHADACADAWRRVLAFLSADG